MERPWVVLVEDDELLERKLTAVLEHALPEVEVRRTPDADEALLLLQDDHSRLLVTEAHSKLVDGVALAACIRRQRPRLPLVFLTDDRGVSRARLTAIEGSHVLDKPPPLEQLIGLVARILNARAGFRGELISHDLSELVQLVALSMPDGALHVSGGEGRGTIWLEEGTVVHAVAPGEQGTSAFQRMLGWTGGGFSLQPNAKPIERSIHLTTTQLLLESARILDEAGAHGGSEQSGTRLVLRSAAEHFERGLEAVHEKRYADALPEWERALGIEPDNRVYEHNLRRLRSLLLPAWERRSSGGAE